MASTRVFQVDSFTSTPFGGNPAGVVPDASGLTPLEMQFVAREMNLSETAFVLSPETEGADFRVRFFTPGCEVPLCGHATVATFTVLCREGVIAPGTPRVYQQTGAGVLPVDLLWKSDEIESIMMTQALPEFRRFEGDPGEILSALGLSKEDLECSYPIGFASTGLWDLMLPLKGLAAMRKISPNHGELARINRAQGVVSTHAWCFETEEAGHDLHVRNLANNQLLDDWRGSSYEDPDKVDVLSPVPLPEVSLFSPAIQAEVENPSGRLFEPLARYRELQGKARFISGSAGASTVRTLMRSSGGPRFRDGRDQLFHHVESRQPVRR